MSFTSASPPLISLHPKAGRSNPPDPHDGDDGIHIVSVNRLDQPGGAVICVVVSWFEDGRWVEATAEFPD